MQPDISLPVIHKMTAPLTSRLKWERVCKWSTNSFFSQQAIKRCKQHLEGLMSSAIEGEKKEWHPLKRLSLLAVVPFSYSVVVD